MATYGDTYCGIYCGACSILCHHETGRADVFVSLYGKVPKAELACGGCKSDTVFVGCRTCQIRDCAQRKGVEHCIDCAEFPCTVYRRWQKFGRVLPHLGECSTSLEAIRSRGVDAWQAEQVKRWSCPDCGTRFSWYASACSHCGRSLKAETHAVSGIKKLALRLLFPMVYRKAKRMSPPPPDRSSR